MLALMCNFDKIGHYYGLPELFWHKTETSEKFTFSFSSYNLLSIYIKHILSSFALTNQSHETFCDTSN